MPTRTWSAPASRQNRQAACASGAAGWKFWYPTKLVRGWLEGPYGNDGLILKAANEATPMYLVFNGANYADPAQQPFLELIYALHRGERPSYSFHQEQLSDRVELKVNVATGHLTLSERDLQIAGRGLAHAVTRSYRTSAGWSLDEAGTWLYPTGDGTPVFGGPGGYYSFEPDGAGGFTRPPGLNATLTKDASYYHLRFDRTGITYRFRATGSNLLFVLDRNGNTISYNWQPVPGSERLSSIVDTQGRRVEFTYPTPESTQLSRMTDTAGNRVYGYGYLAGQLSSYDNPDARRTTYAYCATGEPSCPSGELKEITTPGTSEGPSTTRLSYDSAGRIASLTRVAAGGTGPTTSFDYSLAGRTLVRDPRSNPTTYEYDAERRVTSVTDAKGHIFRTSYSANSDVETTTDALGKVTRNTYSSDGRNNLLSTQLPTGALTSWGYSDPANPYLPTRETDAQGNVVSTAYDSTGNVLTISNQRPSENTQTFNYNPDGTLDWARDARGNLTDYSYYPNGNLQLVTPPPSTNSPLGPTRYEYDLLGRVSAETDGKNQRTVNDYDPLDRLKLVRVQETPTAPLTLATEYGYDGNGNQTQLLNWLATPDIVTSYSYDLLNRLTYKMPQGQPQVSYRYDDGINLTSLVDAGGPVTYVYDARNQLETLIEPNNLKQIRFSYDQNGNRSETAYPNGVSQYLSYDNSQRLARIYAKDRVGDRYLTSYRYSYRNPQGADSELRRSVTDLAGRTTDYSYNVANELVEARSGTGAAMALTSSQKSKLKPTSKPAVTAALSQGSGFTYGYAYDGNGNRLREDVTVNGVTTTRSFLYNEADGLTSANGQTLTYDLNGNRQTGLGQTFVYTPLGVPPLPWTGFD